MKGSVLRAFQRVNFVQKCQVNIVRWACTQEVQVGHAGQAKVEKISKAVKLYLERANAYDKFMKDQVAEFEIGKRHLANIMGLDSENLSQDDVDKAIEYLLPSGLFDKRARPKLRPPPEGLPKLKAAEFGSDGKPFSSFFYTMVKNFNENLHNIAMKIQEVKQFEDEQIKLGNKFDETMQLSLAGSKWFDQKALEKKFDEKVTEQEYKTFILSLEYLSKLPYSYKVKDFIMQFRENLQRQKQLLDIEKPPLKYTEDGKGYAESDGTRKESKASVKVFEKGTGKVSINGKTFLESFPRLADREQILFPLHLAEKLCKVDIEATVEGVGSSGKAGAIRLAISKALQSLVSKEYIEKLRLAGLLTRDPRILERKKPGQRGARAKFTWKKR